MPKGEINKFLADQAASSLEQFIDGHDLNTLVFAAGYIEQLQNFTDLLSSSGDREKARKTVAEGTSKKLAEILGVCVNLNLLGSDGTNTGAGAGQRGEMPNEAEEVQSSQEREDPVERAETLHQQTRRPERDRWQQPFEDDGRQTALLKRKTPSSPAPEKAGHVLGGAPAITAGEQSLIREQRMAKFEPSKLQTAPPQPDTLIQLLTEVGGLNTEEANDAVSKLDQLGVEGIGDLHFALVEDTDVQMKKDVNTAMGLKVVKARQVVAALMKYK